MTPPSDRLREIIEDLESVERSVFNKNAPHFATQVKELARELRAVALEIEQNTKLVWVSSSTETVSG